MHRRWHGRHGHGRWRGRHKHGGRWGLRRRLTFAFAFVALAAVGLTTWFTLGAVFSAQQDLFQPLNESSGQRFERPRFGQASPPWQHPSEHFNWDDPQFAAARDAFARVTRTSFIAGLLAFFLASVAAALVTRVITRPLLALTDGARRLEAGERGVQLAVPRARDELRTLVEVFNGLGSSLERQETLRRNLVADIAHDLRTPLAVLRSEIEGMQDGVVPFERDALSRLHGEIMLLSRLVEDLRTLSSVESGTLTLRLREVKVEGLLERVADSFQTRAAEADSSLTVTDIPPDLTATLDPEQLTRVLGNLVDNALRYASPGAVELGAASTADGVSLWVRDHGPGLASPEQVFERFYRGDAARTSRKEGSGLGLTIARAITEAHGGRLEAANHLEGGAVFTLHLPDST